MDNELIKEKSNNGVNCSRQIIKLAGFNLGNLIYQIYEGKIVLSEAEDIKEIYSQLVVKKHYSIKASHENLIEMNCRISQIYKEKFKGTQCYVLGGSIGTSGYTSVLLPLLAIQQVKRRLEKDGMDKKINNNTENRLAISINKINKTNEHDFCVSLIKERYVFSTGKKEKIKDLIHLFVLDVDSSNIGSQGASLALNRKSIDIKRCAKKAESDKKIPLVVLIDIGGTKVKMILVHLTEDYKISTHIFESFKYPSPATRGQITPEMFYMSIAQLLRPIFDRYKNSALEILPFIGLGQPGNFGNKSQGKILYGAHDLGKKFIGSNPSNLLGNALKSVGYKGFEIHACNDGHAQFYGLIQYLKNNTTNGWEKVYNKKNNGNKIMYLGLGTGLGTGLGVVRANQLEKMELITNASGIKIDKDYRDSLENMDFGEENDNKESIINILKEVFKDKEKYGNLISSKYFNCAMHAVEKQHIATNKTVSKKQRNMVLRNSAFLLPAGLNRSVNVLRELINPSNESQIHYLPLNAMLLNKILEPYITEDKTRAMIQSQRGEIQQKFVFTLETISHELRDTLVKHIRSCGKEKCVQKVRCCQDGKRRKCNYIEAIRLICTAKERSNQIHFVGIGKSHSIAQNLAYIYQNLGIRSNCIDLTGANSENLANLYGEDVVFMISHSGESFELLKLIDYIKHKRCSTIALTGNVESPLARRCDWVMNSYATKNPSSIKEAPTTTTTTALAAGAAVGMVVARYFDYDRDQFYLDHPDLEFNLKPDFEGYVADASFDSHLKIEQIFTEFADAIDYLKDNENFQNSINNLIEMILISYYKKRTIYLTGTGSSLRVAEKVAATMTSIGIDAAAVNSAHLPHGDFAHIHPDDLLIIFSYSAETDHLNYILDLAHKKGSKVVLITSQEKQVEMKQNSDLVVVAPVKQEHKCDTHLVPIPDQKILSSFINLTVGDTLAIMLQDIIGASPGTFAKDAHPSGEIGRKKLHYNNDNLNKLTPEKIKTLFARPTANNREQNEYLLLLDESLTVCFGENQNNKKNGLSKKLKLELIGREMKHLLKRKKSFRNVMIFGMGSMGAGYLARILRKNIGKSKTFNQIVFVDKEQKISAIMHKSQHQYQLDLKPSDKNKKRIIIKNYRCVELKDQGMESIVKIANEALLCDVIFMTIGCGQISDSNFINTLAYIIRRRYTYNIEEALNIVFCENIPVVKDSLAEMRHSIRKALKNPEVRVYFDEHVGIVPAIEEAIVPCGIDINKSRLPVEKDCPPLLIEKDSWCSRPTSNDNIGNNYFNNEYVKYVSEYFPLHMRKLWVHNMGHAVLGYLGYLCGCKTVTEAINNSSLERITSSAMHAINDLLYQRWDFKAIIEKYNLAEKCDNNTCQHEDGKGMEEKCNLSKQYINDRISHYKISDLNDTIERLCRNPRLKIKENERLVGPLNYFFRYTKSDDHFKSLPILLALHSAIRYNNEGVDVAERSQAVIKSIHFELRYFTESKKIYDRICINRKVIKSEEEWEKLQGEFKQIL